MSEVRKFRLNGSDTDPDGVEFYFKVNDGDGHLLCTFCIGNDGLYYYRIGSKVLSPNENQHTRATFDGFISMEDLKDLIETLRKAKLVSQGKYTKLRVSKQNKQVIIKEAVADDEE